MGGKKEKKKRALDGLETTRIQMELAAVLSPARSRLSNLTRRCGKTVLSIIGKPSWSRWGGGGRGGGVEEVRGHLTRRPSPETLMEIYGAERRMRPSSPPDGRRGKKYSLMNSIKCEFGRARPATALPVGRSYLSRCPARRGKRGLGGVLRLDRRQGWTVG